MSRHAATALIRKEGERVLALAEGLSPEEGAKSIRVPPMRGVDEDMRAWSYFQILEHNTIVNRQIGAVIQQLARGEDAVGIGLSDPKRDVMPGTQAGPEQVEAFRKSVDDYLAVESGLPNLRDTATSPHPIFGPFDAHRWHCMFGFHLSLHYPQAAYVVRATLE